VVWRKRQRLVEMVDIDQLPKNAANYTALTPLWFLERAATVHPTRNSLIHGSRRYTWQQTYHRCRRFASALANNSIGEGKTVLSLFLPSITWSQIFRSQTSFLLISLVECENCNSSCSREQVSLCFCLIMLFFKKKYIANFLFFL